MKNENPNESEAKRHNGDVDYFNISTSYGRQGNELSKGKWAEAGEGVDKESTGSVGKIYIDR